MSRKFDIQIQPNDEHDVAALGMLKNHINDHADQHGIKNCATLGQIMFWPDDELPTIVGRLYTGEAAKYLYKHIRKAGKMQKAQESTPGDRQ